MPEWISDPQFFPGATGLFTEDSWQAVVPGRAGPFKQLPAPPKGGVVVLGNYFASVKTYERVRAAELGGLKATWGRLGQLLAATSPREVFLTNAYIGLVDADKDTGRFPSNQEFDARCAEFLRLEIELFSPRAVVCLGVGAARMLARVAPDRLGEWGRTSFRVLTERGERVVEGCQAGGYDVHGRCGVSPFGCAHQRAARTRGRDCQRGCRLRFTTLSPDLESPSDQAVGAAVVRRFTAVPPPCVRGRPRRDPGGGHRARAG